MEEEDTGEPTFSLANSAQIEYDEEAELEHRIQEENVHTIEELPLEMEGERELDDMDGNNSEEERRKYYRNNRSIRHSRGDSSDEEEGKKRYNLSNITNFFSKSRGPSRNVSRAGSRGPSRNPSRPASRSPSRERREETEKERERREEREPLSRRNSERDLYNMEEDDSRINNTGRDENEENKKENNNEEKEGDENDIKLVKVKSNASAIVDFLQSPEAETWRKRIHKTLEDPLYSRLATIIAVFMNIVVLLSVATVVAYPPNYSASAPRNALDKIEIFVSVVLTIEYLLRLVTSHKFYRWFIKPANFIDFGSLLPFYVELITKEAVTGLQLVRFVRLLRILRLIRILKLLKTYRLLYKKKFRVKKKYLKLKYVAANLFEQIHAVVPISLYVILFQYVVMGVLMSDLGQIVGGQILVMVGLFLFIEGIKNGLMPLGETIGNGVPETLPHWALNIVTFITGIIVTFAEPAVVALTVIGKYIPVDRAPHLAYIMGEWDIILLLFVGVGVGFASVLGIMKYAYKWSMKRLIYASVIPNIALTCLVEFGISDLKGVADLAWDCAAVTTGPVTVPIVLALGVGVATKHSDDPTSKSQGFGIVTLASLYPVMFVEILGFISLTKSKESILEILHNGHGEDITHKTPFHELINGVRAILPLIIFLFILLKLVLKANLFEVLSAYGKPPPKHDHGIELDLHHEGLPKEERHAPEQDEVIERRPKWKVWAFWYGGLVAATLGVILFNFGITYGLAELGSQAGEVLPGAFLKLDSMPASPEYSYGVGLFVMLFFSWVLGYLVTQAEPALHVMGDQVQAMNIMRKRTLVFAVSAGVGTGLAIGVLMVIYRVRLTYVIIGGYLLALVMTHYSDDFLVNVAWDSAAVTTGDVTVPFVLVLGVSLADAVGGIGGFGILTMASMVPIHAVLFSGFATRFLKWHADRKNPPKLENDGASVNFENFENFESGKLEEGGNSF